MNFEKEVDLKDMPIKTNTKSKTKLLIAVSVGLILVIIALIIIPICLSQKGKKLISAYHRNPTEDNYLLLRDAVISNYNAILVRKEAKLEELKIQTAGKPGGEEKVSEMEEIVQDMYITYWNRINSKMLRFIDTRLLKWSISQAENYEFIPVMGAGETMRNLLKKKDIKILQIG